MRRPRFAPIPAALPATVPFVGPEELQRRIGSVFDARIGANESGFGPSPHAIQAMQAELPRLWQYGDSTSHQLVEALAEHLDVPGVHITVGEGVDGLLGNLVRLMVGPGDAVVTSDGAYPTFNYHVAGFGGVLHKVPYRHDAEDPQALVHEARRTGAKLVYLANPDNPMGSWHSGKLIQDMLDELPEGTLLVLDEAYAEFAPAEAVPQISSDDPRVIRMRTFSKAYGLAGARIGYAVGHPDLIAGFDRIRNHFGVNRIAQVGALAALRDQAWLADVLANVVAARDRIGKIGADNGMHALPSATNFVAVDTGRDGEYSRALVQALQGQGVFIRMPGVAPLDRCIRISCAPAPELDVLADRLPRAMALIG
ncbi:pyridoxal phosphate-dependent aminotransferase [Paracoccus sp. R12_1]|uniref:pyridoxal phosphate-dependent aminotransferase n=1 Tax=unclassified Paracoccus (in: a-proteobacteria) TaxID=2688777 RepID=UPI001ADACFC0|nr:MULTISPECIES: pyridoxal phosphate-dependent aminotransferase [unclassified Paracoccus (in: a-proteobacteria)]MBO9454819.1 pyridoxal phosphate-dependent aminotransferase [Paracoccus sp. R12_2]MBO9485493.1 pyridoxal phosphate-dependent aminotransferase [Paracoccus sp. R12_1]